MHLRSFGIGALAVGSLVGSGIASPVTKSSESDALGVVKRALNPTFFDCNDEQTNAIKTAFTDLNGLTAFAYESLSADGWNVNRGYNHYFTDEQHDQVVLMMKWALNASLDPQSPVRWNFRCAPDNNQCKQKGTVSWARTDNIPEDLDAPDAKPPRQPGIREMLICPLFFDDKRTQRTLPGEDEAKKEEYCRFKELKKFGDYETGAHTLLHELTHLDTFGVTTGLTEEHHEANEDPDYNLPAYVSHGTVDYLKGSPKDARNLKTTKRKGAPDTFENAESLAACATEVYAMSVCGVDDIEL